MRRLLTLAAALLVALTAVAGPAAAGTFTGVYTAEFGTAPTGSYDSRLWTNGAWRVPSQGRVPALVSWQASAAIKTVEFYFADDTNSGTYTSGATYQYKMVLSVPATKSGNAMVSFSFADFCQYGSDASGGSLSNVGFQVTAKFLNLKGKVVAEASNNYFQTLTTWCPTDDNI